MKNIVVSTHTVAIDAHIVRGRLAAEGIPAYIEDDQYITMDWMMSNALGGVKVSVPESFVKKARVVLENNEDMQYDISELTEADFDDAPEAQYIPEVPLHCPACDSVNVSRLDWFRKLSLPILFLFHSPLAFTKRHYSCDDCGHVFRPGSTAVSRVFRTVITIVSIALTMLIVFFIAFQGGMTSDLYTHYLDR